MRDTRPPIVWRIQEPPAAIEHARDYSSLRGFGEMRTILDPLDNPSVDWDGCAAKFDHVVMNIQPGDYILWAGGDPASAFLAGVLLSSISSTLDLKWLRWDRRTNGEGERTRHGYYTPVEIGI